MSAHVVERAAERHGVVLSKEDFAYAVWAVRSGRAPAVQSRADGSVVYAVRFKQHGGKRLPVVVKRGALVTVLGGNL